ncbi:sister chromatid cohesion protein 1 [Coemansia spiralis]|uniref:Sister chromatid cohesion protein 1 n=2 Tax=Coemansia TaxID=4863 RepID=A0A9W8GC72_9FUNG|nr:Rec8 like protein-domain-containing protein [Coemansia spiralis]KAJ1995996.1 sister chromatid cohesion protein 1 [Coemansia umbellata]KAJ2625441.1 sister chromatid cohesion protein 1 [Coemansia sp. RSA 1358]KAJ2680563.1 sister chromatid cohesion protein 1 [Coemansia spiralis]
MFYAEAILSKKGPLAKVWLAAHLERKLTKAQLLQASIPSSVGAIIGQDQGPPLALRLSGQLLLGVARIYSRKARYLLEDCNEALIRIKMAFRPGAADITSDSMVATHATITLPEALTEFDILLPSSLRIPGGGGFALGGGIDEAFGPEMAAAAALNTSRIQDITLAEQSFDISAVARGTGHGDKGGLGEEDLLGRDDDFRLNLDEDFILSPLPQQIPEPELGMDISALEPEIGRDALQQPDESMIGLQADDLSLLGRGFGDGHVGHGALADLTREELAKLDGSGLLQFGNASLLGVSRGSNTQEVALQEAEAEVLAISSNQARPSKRRRLNLSELVTNEATSLSPDEIRNRLNDATDIMRVPTYLPPTNSARLEDMSSAAIASRLLASSSTAPFAALFASGGLEIEQAVPTGIAGDSALFGPAVFDQTVSAEVSGFGQLEPVVPEHGEFEADEFRIEDAGEDIAFGAGAGAAGQQLESELILADKSLEQLERLEEESFQRQVEGQRQEGISLFANTLPVRDEDISLREQADEEIRLSADAGASATAADASGYSKSTIRAIHMLDSASRKANISVSDTAAPSEDTALSFANITNGVRRSDSVKLFFELLVLKTKGFIDVKQELPFEDILVAPRSKLRMAADSIQVSAGAVETSG